jgi:hypothetical protein
MGGGLTTSKTPGVTLNSGLTRPPPLIGGYHATSSSEIFNKFKQMNEPGHDIGTHFSTDPNMAGLYPWHLNRGMTIDSVAPRTMPVVADVQKPMRYPLNPVDWRDPEMVVNNLKLRKDWGQRVPQYQIDALDSAMKSPGGWEKNFFPAVKDMGYDSVQYPHSANFPRYDSYMALDPAQVMPKFSPEGQALAAERGVKEPLKRFDWEDIKHIIMESANGWDKLHEHFPGLMPKD